MCEECDAEDDKDDEEYAAEELPESSTHWISPRSEDVLFIDDKEVFHGFYGTEWEEVAALLISFKIELLSIVCYILEDDMDEFAALGLKDDIPDPAEKLAGLAHDTLVEKVPCFLRLHTTYRDQSFLLNLSRHEEGFHSGRVV